MTHDCLVAVLHDVGELNEALDLLEAAQVGREHVSIVSRSVEQEDPQATTDVRSGDEAETKTARGAAAGSLVGALAGASLLFIPGVGPLIASGAFAGALTGGIVGGYLGSMQGWGVHEDHVRQYDNAVREGKILMVVHGSPLHLARAQRALQTRFDHVHLHAAESSDAPELFAETSMKHL
jgi:phage tail tape-measure protein